MPNVNDYPITPLNLPATTHRVSTSLVDPETNEMNRLLLDDAQKERDRLNRCLEVRMVFTLDGKLLNSSAPDEAFTNNEYALFGKAIPHLYTWKGEYKLTRDIGVPHSDNYRHPGTSKLALHGLQQTNKPLRCLIYERQE